MGTKHEARAKAEALGLTWRVVAPDRDWDAVIAALERFQNGGDEEVYPRPVTREGDVLTDSVLHLDGWWPVDALQLASVDAVGLLRPLAKLPRLKALRLRFVHDHGSHSDTNHLDLSSVVSPTDSMLRLTCSTAGRAVDEPDSLPGVANLEHLEELRIEGCSVPDLRLVSRLHSLEVLDCRPLGSLEALASKSTLRRLRVPHSDVADLRPLESLDKLEELDVSYTKVVDVSALGRLPNLRRLYLQGTGVFDLRPLSRCSALEELVLDDCPVRDVGPLAQLPNLKHLRLPRVPDLGPVAGAHNLATLHVHVGPRQRLLPLAMLERLVQLDVVDDHIGLERVAKRLGLSTVRGQLQALKRQTPTCQIIHYSECSNGDMPPVLRAFVRGMLRGEEVQ